MMMHEWLKPHTNPLNSVLVKGVKFFKCQTRGCQLRNAIAIPAYVVCTYLLFSICTDSERLFFYFLSVNSAVPGSVLWLSSGCLVVVFFLLSGFCVVVLCS